VSSLPSSSCKLLTFLHYISQLTVRSFFVETAGKTLEDLHEIFEAPNPRKASVKRAKVEMTETGQVLNVHEV
jgi:hypothetical protein